jgi:hypothetical protein
MDIPVQGDASSEKRHATLRECVASLSATTGRAAFEHRAPVAGEGAR